MAEFHSGLKIRQKIGNGQFGEVYLGDDPVHGRVAVKVLSRDPIYSDAKWAKHKASFLSEGQNLSKATHQNVVKVYHIVEEASGDSIQLCMAYCPGGSLQSEFEKGPMAIDTVRKVGTEVLMGLGALHARNMLHRDIKPGNILLDRSGVAQIADFGLVTDDLILGYGSQAGYRDHIAFETWQGKGTSVQSDIWAFGMTLFRLLHGKAWYEELPSPRNAVPQGHFADTLKWLPHVPKSWRRAIRKMLHDDPASRYTTAAQVLNALSQLPTTPNWSATVTPKVVRWELQSGQRRRVLEWIRYSERRHEWIAWSEPLGSGQKKTLGRSNGIVGGRETIAELERFFGP